MALIENIYEGVGFSRKRSKAKYNIYYEAIPAFREEDKGVRLYIGNNPSSIVTAITIRKEHIEILVDIFRECCDFKLHIDDELNETLKEEAKEELEEEYNKKIKTEREKILCNLKGYEEKIYKMISSFKEDTTTGEVNGANWTAEVNGETIVG